MQSGRVGEAPAERGSLSEYFPSIPIMAALMGKTPSESASGSTAAGSTGFKGFALVRRCQRRCDFAFAAGYQLCCDVAFASLIEAHQVCHADECSQPLTSCAGICTYLLLAS